MSTEKPSHNEAEYFAKLDAELIARQRAKHAADAAAAERKSHFMKCPKCGHNLGKAEYRGIQIDHCNHCGGFWLDRGEIDLILKHHDPGFIGRLFGDLLRSLKQKLTA